jgi:hypothetical protein
MDGPHVNYGKKDPSPRLIIFESEYDYIES